jgi:hypothetical protein
LLRRDWQSLFIDLRPLWSEARLLIFGHALLEKLVSPRASLTAHVWRVQCPLHDMAAADDWLAMQLDERQLMAKPFTPLQVLGVPGWWPANESPAFYSDTGIFRPPAAKS